MKNQKSTLALTNWSEHGEADGSSSSHHLGSLSEQLTQCRRSSYQRGGSLTNSSEHSASSSCRGQTRRITPPIRRTIRGVRGSRSRRHIMELDQMSMSMNDIDLTYRSRFNTNASFVLMSDLEELDDVSHHIHQDDMDKQSTANDQEEEGNNDIFVDFLKARVDTFTRNIEYLAGCSR